MKKVQLIKEMAERIKFEEGVTPKEFIQCLEELGVVYNQNYVKTIRGYMFDLASKKIGYLEKMCDLVEEAEPYKNMKGNEVWLSDTVNVFYCEECGVFVYDYEDYDFEEVKVYCKKAPEWFRKGWKGIKGKTLSKDDFVKYYKMLNENSCFDEVGIEVYSRDLSELKYLQLDSFKKKIDRYIRENIQSKNVAA